MSSLRKFSLTTSILFLLASLETFLMTPYFLTSIITFIIGILFLFLFTIDNKLIITTITSKSDKISNNLKIVHLSDLHSTQFGINQKDIIEKITSLKPDLIFLTGDIFDDKRDPNIVFPLLLKLKDIAPSYFSTGNHEFYKNSDTDLFLSSIKDFGVDFLDNEEALIHYLGNSISITGFNDPKCILKKYRGFTSEREVKNSWEKIKLTKDVDLKLLLSHKPHLIEDYSNFSFDYIFSGHAHGGQVIIPRILQSGLFATGQGFFPKYTRGIISIPSKNSLGSKLVISRGLSIFKFPPRILNPPEIFLLIIESTL